MANTSDLPPKISITQSGAIKLRELQSLLRVRSVRELERKLNLAVGTLSKAIPSRESSNKSSRRPLSPESHHALLRAIVAEFSSKEEMEQWLENNWTAKIQRKVKDSAVLNMELGCSDDLAYD